MVEEAALMKAIVNTRQQIDFLWQFFVTVQIALFALLFIYDHAVDNMSIAIRLMAAAGAALFCWINGHAIADTYLLLDAMMRQYAVWYGNPKRFEPAFLDHFVKLTYADRPRLVLATHSLSFGVVAMSLFWRRFIQSKQRS